VSKPDEKQVVAALLKRHGRTFSGELGIKLESNSPSALFRWLCAALLFSARINHGIATEAARALSKHGWTTAKKMAATTWAERARVLNHAGYARYDEKTSRMLAATSELLLDRYGGDLRQLREAAGHDPATEKKLLMECKGIGDVGADIFLREAQVAWAELQPFADPVALKSAKKLGLPGKVEELTKSVPKKDFPRLLAALVRCQLAKDHKEVLRAAKAG
jgi:endonuclease III